MVPVVYHGLLVSMTMTNTVADIMGRPGDSICQRVTGVSSLRASEMPVWGRASPTARMQQAPSCFHAGADLKKIPNYGSLVPLQALWKGSRPNPLPSG